MYFRKPPGLAQGVFYFLNFAKDRNVLKNNSGV